MWGCTALQNTFSYCFQCSEMQDQGAVLQLRACIKKLQCSFRLFHRDSHKSSEGIVQHGQISVGFCPRAKKPTQLSLGDAHGGCCCSVDGLTWELQQLGFRDVKGKRRAGGVNKGSVGRTTENLLLPQDRLRASAEQLVTYHRDSLVGRLKEPSTQSPFLRQLSS